MRISFEKMQNLLREADIEGLIGAGAPNDEYDSEAQIMVQALSELSEKEMTIEGVLIIVAEIWRQSFDLDNADICLRQSAMNSLVQKIVQDGTASYTDV